MEQNPLTYFIENIVSNSLPLQVVVLRNWARSAQDFEGIPTTLLGSYTPPERGNFSATKEHIFLDLLEKSDVLSLDIFDTALIRKVAHPTKVFDIL